jgi:hypothetical protein
MVERAREVVAGEIALVVGGFHMGGYSRTEIEETIAGFRENEVRQVTPTHCTGDQAQAMFQEAYGDDYIEGGAGRVFVIGAGGSAEVPGEEASEGFLLSGVGFSTPESVLHDPESDLYLVSNINGGPGDKDGNGFISRLSPQGEVLGLKWIDGRAEGVTLNGPTGMALAGDVLYVADVDVVRSFERDTGAPLGEIVIPGAVFLNDVAAADDGILYVSDSGGDAIYRITPGGAVDAFAPDQRFAGPNGIQVQGDAVRVANYGGTSVFGLDSDGQLVADWDLPMGGLDGLLWLEDGSMLVSSWDASAIYLIDPAGDVSDLFSPITSPADIGLDSKRNLLLIPHFQHNSVEAKPLP